MCCVRSYLRVSGPFARRAAQQKLVENPGIEYRYYDSQLSATLQKVDSLVDQINETAEDSLSVYLPYAALALSVLNSVAMNYSL